MLANPRRRRHHRSRRRNAFSPSFLAHRFVPRVNGHRRRRNPEGLGGAFSLATHPLELLKTGAVGAAAAYATIVIPNALMPNAGTDMTSKALRLLTRAVAGGILHAFGSRFMPGQGHAILTGAMIGAGGGFVLDLFGVTLIVGTTDTTQTAIVPTFTIPSLAGYRGGMGVYTPRQLTPASGYGAYTPGGFRGPVVQGAAMQMARRNYDGR